MRVAVVLTLVWLSAACASEKLALMPPPDVNFTGHWRLNVEESDDPLHLIQSQTSDPTKVAAASRGQGGQGGGRGARGRAGGAYAGTTDGPSVPAVGALSEGLRWPGKEIEIKQVFGVVALTSSGINQVYQPNSGEAKARHLLKSSSKGEDTPGRSMPALDRGPPPTCGWDDKTLVVQSADADEDHPPFEERYSLSQDGQRLIEVVGFRGGRYSGFTMSRVWDRVNGGSQAQ